MSADPRATDAKNDGSIAWSAGQYDKAIEHFSTAITFGGDKEFMKVLYSNRSAAYLKLNKVEESLKDANKCVELDQNWGKGFTRKGDALLAGKKYTEAYNAYNTALRLTPNDASLTAKCEQAMKAMRNTASSSSSSPSSSGRYTSPPSAPVTGYVKYAKMAVLVLSIVYMLPLGRQISSTAYRSAVGLFAAMALVSLYKKYGFPKFNSAYAEKVFTDPECMNLFLGMFLIMTKPYMLALSPVFFSELTHFTPQILTYVKNNVNQMQSQVQPMIARFMPSMAGVDVSRMIGSLSAPQFNYQLMKMSAICEVYQGLFLIFELLLPTRNVMLLYLWWQYLQMRYTMDQTGNVKAAFITVDQKITGLVNHRLCPGVVRRGYDMVKSFMAKQVERTQRQTSGEAPAAGGGGLMGGLSSALGKCTIM